MWQSFLRTWRMSASIEPRKSDISTLQERKLQSTLANTCIVALRCCAHPFNERVKIVAFDLLCHMLERGTQHAQQACLTALDSGVIAENFMDNIRTTLREYGENLKVGAVALDQADHVVKQLHFLNVLCQNSRVSQNFLRGVRQGREAARGEVNIVKELVMLCETMQQHNNFDGNVACEVIQTLCAVVQGPNAANQSLLGNTKLFNLVNRFLHMTVINQKRSEYVKRVVFRGKLYQLLLYLIVGNTQVASENARKMISEVALLKLAISINLSYKVFRRYCAFCNQNPDETTLDPCEALNRLQRPHVVRRLLHEELFSAFFIFKHLSTVDNTNEVFTALQVLKLHPNSLQSEHIIEGLDCTTPSINWFDTDDDFGSMEEERPYRRNDQSFNATAPKSRQGSLGQVLFKEKNPKKKRVFSRKSVLHVDGKNVRQELGPFEDKPNRLVSSYRDYGIPMPVDNNSLSFLEKYTANIEIVAEDGTLCSILFPLHPQIVSMFGFGDTSKSTADGVLMASMIRNVERGDPAKRSQETLQKLRAASIHLNHVHLLRQRWWLDDWVYLNGHNLEYLGGAVAVFFYVMVLLMQRYSDKRWTVHLGQFLHNHLTALDTMAVFVVLVLHNIISVLVWYRYTIANIPEQFELYKESARIALIQAQADAKKGGASADPTDKLDTKVSDIIGAAENSLARTISNSENFFKSYTDTDKNAEARWSTVLIDMQDVNTLRSDQKIIRPICFREALVHFRLKEYLTPVFFTGEFHYRLLFVVTSLLATFMWSSVTYAAMFLGFHLSVIFLSTFGQQLLTSIKFASKNISMILLIHLLLLFMMGLINYFMLYKNLTCSTTFGCMYETIRYGMLEGSKTALYVTGVASESFEAAPAATYFIIFYVGWFMPKILQAQLVDALAQMRMKERRQAEDDAAKCFICTRAWTEFESALQGGFDHHVKKEHATPSPTLGIFSTSNSFRPLLSTTSTKSTCSERLIETMPHGCHSRAALQLKTTTLPISNPSLSTTPTVGCPKLRPV
jgi:hypothetical protein